MIHVRLKVFFFGILKTFQTNSTQKKKSYIPKKKKKIADYNNTPTYIHHVYDHKKNNIYISSVHSKKAVDFSSLVGGDQLFVFF